MRLAAALALLTLALPASAQGRWTDTFAVPGLYDGGFPGASANAVAADGAGALVGGAFRIVDDVEVNGVARWTGAAWEALGGGVRCADCGGSPFPARVQAVVRDAAGAVWVTGHFDTAVQPDGSALTVDGLARWTGAAWDAPGQLVGGVVFGYPVGYALLVQGASVVVAGSFEDVLRPDGTAVGATNVARWTGGAWEPLSQSAIGYALAEDAAGRVLSTGYVTTPDGTEGVAVTAWDGAAWQPVTGTLGGQFATVRALVVDGDGLLVGGAYVEGGRAADGSLVPSRGVVRWDGAAWQPVGRGIVGAEVRALARDGAGLLVGGLFDGATNTDGSTVAARGLARWTGTAWQAVPDVSLATVDALTPSGPETLVGGRFAVQTGLGGATRRAVNLAALSHDDAWRPVSQQTGRDGTFFSDGSGRYARLAPDGCGGVHVHAPEEAGPRPGDGMAAFRTWDGAAWQPVPDGLRATVLRFASGAAPGSVIDLAAVPGACDAFVIAGRFGSVDVGGAVIASANVARWSGAAWQPLGRGTDGVLNAVAVGPDGAVTVGGQFATAFQTDGTPVGTRGVGRWTAGGGWTALGDGLRSTRQPYQTGVFALLDEPGGAVVVGGGFEGVAEADGTERPANSVARWTGTAWETFGGPLPIFGLPTDVQAVARWNGDLVVAGTFSQVAQPSGETLDARAVAAWDGTAWRALPGLDTNVSSLAVVDGELFASDGLGFAAARWTGSAWVPLGTGAPGSVFDLAAAGRYLYASGAFETAGGIGSPGLARFDLDGVVASDAPASSEIATLAVFPNPARTSATLRFRLDAPGAVRVTLLDALGRTVAVLADGEMGAGEQTARVDVSGLPAGVYVARLAAGGRVQTQRITVVR